MKKPMRKIILFCILGAVIFFIARNALKKEPVKQMPARPAETALAIQKDASRYIDSFGNLYSPGDVDIKSQVTGEIKEINFVEGGEVNKGDLLFTIDPAPFKAELDRAESILLQDLADLKLKKNTLERNKKLFQKQLISQQDFDTYTTDLATAEARVKSDNADIELAKINLAYCYIQSPVDGLTGKRQVDLGNIVMANNGPTLVNIKTIDSLYVDFNIAETDLTKVRDAMNQGKLKIEIYLNTSDTEFYSGELQMLDNAVDNNTGTILLRAVVDNKKRKLWSGEFVRVRLILGIIKDATLVPYQAVQMGQMGPYIFVVTPENKADLRPVVSGSRQGDYIVIESGVKPGERVVTAGHLGLSPGVAIIDVTEQRK
ncbi:MAG: efflux RND transporter periplasmic adaptor subunit [Candidatus Omnitrophica bacterium]|nr:efflux RND transporter periplasmic adaptor subunit [Candidatus Omnitrophota bacterium]MDD5610659.1 efflux RND transporter periplasmic adaptor subunit [Candidatus Omnitrophota bacterium]